MRLQEKQSKMKDEKSKKKLAEELEKRKIEHGVNSLNKSDATRKVIFEFGEVDKFKLNEKKSGVPEIELFDFQEEEQRDVEAIKIFMKKYSKLWKFYFNKYANIGFSAKEIRNFDMLNDKHNTINLAELLKLLKDHDFDKRYMTKEEWAAILRLVNFKVIKKSELTAMDYPGFLEWIVQAAVFMFTKPPEDKSHFPPVECLIAFVKKLEKAQKDKGASTILFEDPDATCIGDATLLKALNKKIKEDPNYPLPEDYRKVKEKEIVYTYKLPDFVKINSSKRFWVEMLDELIFKQFDFHILEPIVSYNESVKVKPVIRKQFNNATEERKTPRYLQSLNKRQKPKELNDKASMSAYQKMRESKNRPPKLREVLALEVAKFDKADRDRAQETAEVLEEILQAFEKGYKKLPNREKFGPMGIQNSVLKENAQKKKEDRKYEKEREEKRKKRDDQVKAEIKKKEEEKKKMLADTKDERMKKKEARKKKKQELKAQREKEKNQKAKEYEEKKKEEMTELERKQKEEEERERKRKEKFEKENKEFLKQQAKKIRKDFKEMVNEKKSIQQAEKEYEEMETKLKENMKKKMEKYFKENKDNLKKEKEEKEAIIKFMSKKPVAAVFSKYEDQLKYYFYHYARSEHHALSRDFEKEYETLSFREFKKFAYEWNIIPTLMPVHEISYIYNQLLREKLDLEPDSLKAIDYEHFKKGIVRISAVGQSLLGGQNGPKFEKKMEEEKAKADEEAKKKEQTINKNATKTPAKNVKKSETKVDLEREVEDPKSRAKSSKKPERKDGTLMERGACSFLYPPSAPPVGGRGGTGSKNFPVLPSPSKIKILY